MTGSARSDRASRHPLCLRCGYMFVVDFDHIAPCKCGAMIETAEQLDAAASDQKQED